jgi:hypothetical protein
MAEIIAFAPRGRNHPYTPTPAVRSDLAYASKLPRPRASAAEMYEHAANLDLSTMGSDSDAAYGRLQLRLGVVLNGLRKLRGTAAAKASIESQIALLEQLDERDHQK